VDQMAGILKQLGAMDTKIPNELAVALLVASIDVPELSAVTTAIKTLADETATWDEVTERLIEEQRTLKGKNTYERATPASNPNKCVLCGKRGHAIPKCYLNPSGKSS